MAMSYTLNKNQFGEISEGGIKIFGGLITLGQLKLVNFRKYREKALYIKIPNVDYIKMIFVIIFDKIITKTGSIYCLLCFNVTTQICS